MQAERKAACRTSLRKRFVEIDSAAQMLRHIAIASAGDSLRSHSTMLALEVAATAPFAAASRNATLSRFDVPAFEQRLGDEVAGLQRRVDVRLREVELLIKTAYPTDSPAPPWHLQSVARPHLFTTQLIQSQVLSAPLLASTCQTDTRSRGRCLPGCPTSLRKLARGAARRISSGCTASRWSSTRRLS